MSCPGQRRWQRQGGWSASWAGEHNRQQAALAPCARARPRQVTAGDSVDFATGGVRLRHSGARRRQCANTVTYTTAWNFDATQPPFGLVGEGGMVLPAGANGRTARQGSLHCGLSRSTSRPVLPTHDVRVRATNGAGLYDDASVCIAPTDVSRKAANRRKAAGQHRDGQ
jgi:hypothetical protein